MGSSNDGPALPAGSAAQDTPADPDAGNRRSFFSRLFGPRNAPDPTRSEPGQPHGQVVAAAAPAFGLGNLRRLRVDDVAVPKADVMAVPLDISRDDLAAVFREHGFSRMPVYKDTLDKPVGLVMLKDFALTYGFGHGNGRFSLRKLIRPVLYAPPSMRLAVLLQKMQTDRVHMALVIDEYGGVDGLVTIEDLIETVVGDISDEHDDEEGPLWIEEKPGVYLAQSIAPLSEFEASIGQSLRNGDEDGEIDTLGGLVFLRAGRVPARGEVIPHEGGGEFEVVDADPRRIKRLRVRLRPAPAPAASSGGASDAEAVLAAALAPANPPADLPADPAVDQPVDPATKGPVEVKAGNAGAPQTSSHPPGQASPPHRLADASGDASDADMAASKGAGAKVAGAKIAGARG